MRRNDEIAEALGVLAYKRRHKYGAVRTELDGITFPSFREASRYAELQMLADAGDIYDLEVDARSPIRYELAVNGLRVAYYRPDFRYTQNSRVICEDTKSEATMTPVFRLKAKLFRILYPDTELRIL